MTIQRKKKEERLKNEVRQEVHSQITKEFR
jgi:hypothetical protein